jgi:hypothetical protein
MLNGMVESASPATLGQWEDPFSQLLRVALADAPASAEESAKKAHKLAETAD